MKLGNIKIETPRLTLRLFRESDLDDFYEYASVDGVGQSAGWPPHKNKEQTKKILDYFIEDEEVLALYHKEDNKVIGSIGVHKVTENINLGVDKDKCISIGYVISKEYWGLGFATEAATHFVEYLFNNTKYDYIVVEHFEENMKSKNVIEKLGGRYICNFDYYCNPLDKSFVSYVYIIDKK